VKSHDLDTCLTLPFSLTTTHRTTHPSYIQWHFRHSPLVDLVFSHSTAGRSAAQGAAQSGGADTASTIDSSDSVS
jgi:hypothetical protein